MSVASLIIVGEVFLVLLTIGGFIYHYLNRLNNQLQQNNNNLKQKIKDQKSRIKGLQSKVHELTETSSKLELQLSALEESESGGSEIEKEYLAVQAKLSSAESDRAKLQLKLNNTESELKAKNKKIEELESQVEELESQVNTDSASSDFDYEEMYYDLKNSIAYNMEGGENYLDTLKDRLKDNGNTEEGHHIDKLKERYSSISRVVGIVSDVEMFDQTGEPADALKRIHLAEGAVDEANSLLKDIASRESRVTHAEEQETVETLKQELKEINLIKDKLHDELKKSASQLMAFVAKARLFQAQKEQIKMHKETEAQLHRNYVNLNSEFKLLTRKYKTSSAQNNALNTQLKKLLEDDEAVVRIDSMRAELEEKEQEMERLSIEKDMLEQQYIMMSKDYSEESSSTDELERLRSEHNLLERQFLEVLKELDPDVESSELTDEKSQTEAEEGDDISQSDDSVDSDAVTEKGD